MLISLIIIISLIWAAVIGTIYSNFLVFHSNFAETDSYHKAYYASIAALERWELVTKQRQPWFKWEGWRTMNQSHWSYNAWASDWVIDEWFSYLSKDSNKTSTVSWLIDSITNRIPEEWKWDIDRMLSTWDSVDYNTMDYNNSEIFLLYKDPYETILNPYQKINETDMVKSNITSISWTIRLPGYLYNIFGNLDTTKSVAWSNIKNDAIVDRQVLWKKDNHPFTIFATQRVSSNWTSFSEEDTIIREWDINDWYNFEFGNSKAPYRRINGSDSRTIISSESSNILSFEQIFQDTNSSQNQIRFSLLNMLKNGSGAIYPFLEYQANFNWDTVPDKYYTINAEWNYGDYQINLIIQKPIKKESILQSFTTIF